MSTVRDDPTPPPILREPHTQPVEMVLHKVWERLNVRNEHFVGAVVGREGSGKSHTCLKLGSIIDPEFTADQVFFRIEEFLKLLRDDEFRSGAIYVLDEAGVAFGNRTWQDRAQVLANQALQLIRDHNVGLLFSLPRLGELDSQTQGRLQAFYEITEKEEGEHVKGKWKWIDPDRSGTTGEIYKKFPRTERGERIKSVGFTPPASALIEPYQAEKDEFQAEVYDEAISELEAGADGDDKDEKNADDIADEILENEGVRRYLKTINNGSQTVLDKEKIKSEHGIGARRAKQVKSRLMEEIDIDVM